MKERFLTVQDIQDGIDDHYAKKHGLRVSVHEVAANCFTISAMDPSHLSALVKMFRGMGIYDVTRFGDDTYCFNIAYNRDKAYEKCRRCDWCKHGDMVWSYYCSDLSCCGNPADNGILINPNGEHVKNVLDAKMFKTMIAASHFGRKHGHEGALMGHRIKDIERMKNERTLSKN